MEIIARNKPVSELFGMLNKHVDLSEGPLTQASIDEAIGAHLAEEDERITRQRTDGRRAAGKEDGGQVIGLDTMILLPVFIDDDPLQAAAARRFILKAAPSGLFVSDLVLAEMVWTLGRSSQGQPGEHYRGP